MASIGGSTIETFTLNGSTSYARAYSQLWESNGHWPQSILPLHDEQQIVNLSLVCQFVPLQLVIFSNVSILNPVILIICPLRLCLIPGRTVRIIFAVPKKLTSNCSLKFQSLISSKAPTKADIISPHTFRQWRSTLGSSIYNNINPSESFLSLCNRRLA
jgi:hypothetical protein